MDDDIDERDWNEDEEEEEEPEAVVISEEKHGEYVHGLREMLEWDKRMEEHSPYPRDKRKSNEETQAMADRAEEITKARNELNERLMGLDPDRASTWLLEQRQAKIESNFRHELALASVGLTNDMIFDVADECSHIVEDSTNEALGDLRKELRDEMNQLSRDEREEILENLLASGKITESQYRYLRTEFK